MKAMLLAGAAAIMLTGAARAAPADPVIDRYVAWRGGAAFEKATTVHMVGQATYGAYSGPVERWISPDRTREAAALGVLRTDESVSPGDSWTVTLSGQVEALPPQEIAAARRRAALAFDDVLRGADGARVTLAPAETLDGVTYAVVRLSFEGPDRYDLLIDPATGALGAARVTENKATTLTRYADWRMVDAVRMPFREIRQTQDDPQPVTMDFRAVEVGRRAAAAVWKRPAAKRLYAFTGAAKVSQALGFEFYLGSRIYIPAKVQGIETHVLLDSGAEASVLDKAWAEKAGIKPGAAVWASGTGGGEAAELAGGVDIDLGGVVLKNLTVALIDMGPIEKLIGRPIPVILGKEVMNELVVDLDFEGRTIAFHEPSGFRPPAGAVPVAASPSGGLRAVPVSIEGKPPVLMDFDIGNGSPLIVFSDYVARTGLLTDGRKVSKTLSGAVGGVRTRDVATVKAITFGGVTFHDVPATFPGSDGSSVDSARTLGNIGLPVLSRFHLYTDYAHDRLWLKPVAHAADTPFPKDRSGFVARMDGAVAKVLMVAPGSPAEAAGFKTGDNLAAFNGKPLSQEQIQSLKILPAGTKIGVTLADGSTKTLVLSDYF
ncbi:pepsin/retropepsin-like aspartic protease family protein [Phenylobacterium sp.]|uniref:pepsin/retropepsin-like aspartic protease family protein n=1 Tax=Phenylobacterium sp. TaxID=1871053 RepID=UPI00271B9835|nr:aspartyl protease family protein [Phenylobacterium sp.]MDO8380896.1 aspartyl protease family protein [Phenylobacterium sp.]